MGELSEAAYAGSRILQPVSDSIGLPIDQVNAVYSCILDVFFDSTEVFLLTSLLVLIQYSILVLSFQINFIFCLLSSIIIGFPYRILLPPSKENVFIRHSVQVIFGVALCFFCFGWSVNYALYLPKHIQNLCHLQNFKRSIYFLS